MLNWILGTIAIGLWVIAYGWYHWGDVRGVLARRRASSKQPPT